MRALAGKENLKKFGDTAGRFQGLGYRKWMADGRPRTSLHLRFGAAE